jgi:hypothetical protein
MKRQVYEMLISIVVSGVLLTGCATSPPPIGIPIASASQPPISTPISSAASQPISTPVASAFDPGSDWQEEFDISACTMASTGSNQYFILEPGFQLVLEGGTEVLIITVLDETVEVDGIETRVVEERESKNGEINEVSRNFFAICEQTKDVYYFGEEVDIYQGGQLVSHSGAWRSGEGNAKFGLIMPGNPAVGMKYYQEVAPGVAMDRAEIVSLDETFSTPAGEFSNSLKTKEGTALNLLEVEYKTYAPGIGLIQDEKLLLTQHGFVNSE